MSTKPSVELLMKRQDELDEEESEISHKISKLKRDRDAIDEEITLQEHRLEQVSAESSELEDAINVLLVGRKKRSGVAG